MSNINRFSYLMKLKDYTGAFPFNLILDENEIGLQR